jgi:putative glutamine amidotransferase
MTLIAVAAPRLHPGRVDGWPWGAAAVPDPYLDAVGAAGGTPVLLTTPPDTHPDRLFAILHRFDALLLVGGGDIDPVRYEGASHAEVYDTDGDRDRFEMALALAAGMMDLPTLGICRGMQILNVARGGTLHPHLRELSGLHDHGDPRTARPARHQVGLRPGTQLAAALGVTSVEADCYHHQGVARLGGGLEPAALAEDGTIEALVCSSNSFTVGVQWHPELAASNPTTGALFGALVAAAAGRSPGAVRPAV